MTVAPEQVLKELAGLWVSLGKQEAEGTGVLRACSMTLVVAAEETEDPQAIWETLAALMPEHPSRAILLRVSPEPERAMAARVFSQCWMPFGQRRQICCEQIEIAVSTAGLPHLPPVLLPLAVPDLPLIFWCRSPALLAPELGAMASKTVVDSARGFDLGTLREWTRAGRVVADLEWTRLTRWRELIARIFENRDYLARLPAITGVRVAFHGEQPRPAARYMGAWLMECARAAGAQPRLAFEPGAREGGLLRVELQGPGLEVAAERTEAGCAEARVGELISRISLPRPAEHALMAEELAIPGRDPVFEAVLAAAPSVPADLETEPRA